MNLNRSIEIMLSASLLDEKGVSIALYELRERTGRLEICAIAGAQTSRTWARELLMPPTKNRVQVFPIEFGSTMAGLLCVKPVQTATLSPQLISRIKNSCDSLASLLALARKIRSYDNLVSEISALHLELADQKISDRARGLLESRQSPEAIAAHVNRVSESITFINELHAAIDNSRSQLRARQLLHSAKEKLRKDQGISEEEAYLTLRHMSRKTRTPLGAIAKRVLGQDAAVAARMQ
jgi:AmiR/NasT family two-component response regulator